MEQTAAARRVFLKGSGALIVAFSLAGCSGAAGTTVATPSPRATANASGTAATGQTEQTVTSSTAPSTAGTTVAPASRLTSASSQRSAVAPATVNAKELDSWLAVTPDNTVTVYSGRVELGTGITTALTQIAAEELDVAVSAVTMVMGDTAKTPNEGYTSGSQSIRAGGTAIRQAAAEARRLLLGLAAQRLGASADQLTVKDGVVSVASDPSKTVRYGDLLGGRRFEHQVTSNAPLKRPQDYHVVGQPVWRVDLPAKLTGHPSYLEDVRVPGMLHGRIIRPAGVEASLLSLDEGSIQHIPGIVKVVRSGNFLGVVAEREEQAIQAARTLKVTWQTVNSLPDQATLASYLRSLSSQSRVLVQHGDVAAGLNGAARRFQATFTQPYQLHGSIGPSCAVADVQADKATIWSHTQGVYPLRDALAQLFGMPSANVEVIHVDGSGCYGHNGADDVAADAALLSKAAGQPVRVQWMRQDEHAWEPTGPAMVMQVSGGLDGQGNVVGWDYAVWTPTHSTRPGGQAGNLLAGRLISPPAPTPRNGTTGGDRNAPTNYTFPNQRVTAHFLASSPLRSSALRGLGGPANTFANETFLDELATAAGVDPLAYRLRYLEDSRAQAALKAAAQQFGWQARVAGSARANGSTAGTGQGLAFARYENTGAYVATCAQVMVDRASGRVQVQRLVVAHDCGLVINPDGLRNQIEGNLIQSTSRALKEQVTFDRARVTSVDWASYPILTFPEVPDIQVVLLDHPELPAEGAGEPATLPTAAAIANAVFDATGARLRDVPFTPDRVKAALT